MPGKIRTQQESQDEIIGGAAARRNFIKFREKRLHARQEITSSLGFVLPQRAVQLRQTCFEIKQTKLKLCHKFTQLK